jgi:transcriptional regulator of heat shock response
MKLSLRQQKILAAIVKEYSETAAPVGSKELGNKYSFKESSATIRNEMKVLEKAGFINQPHKSAGRVPTDSGYRFFVNELMRRFEISEKERKLLREELSKIKHAHEQLGHSISHLIAQVSGQAAFTLLPNNASSSGLSYIVGEPEMGDRASVKSIAELFDNLDKYAPKLLKQGETQTFIGGESPLPVPKDLSLVVSSVKFKGNKKGVIGILGPKRMAYAKNMSLLEYLSKLISGTSVLLLIIYA